MVIVDNSIIDLLHESKNYPCHSEPFAGAQGQVPRSGVFAQRCRRLESQEMFQVFPQEV